MARVLLKFNDVWRSTDQGATWTQVSANAEWSARYGFGSVVLADGSVVLMGGGDGSTLWNDVWRSTDQGATWAQITSNAGWTGRTGHTSVALPDGRIVLMGGYTATPGNDVWRWETAGSYEQTPIPHLHRTGNLYSGVAGLQPGRLRQHVESDIHHRERAPAPRRPT